jgi:hypothetical protein
MSCDPQALAWEAVAPGSTVKCEVDFTGSLVNWHVQGHYYALTARVRVPGVAGLEYECTIAGETGAAPVRWPKVAAGTVTDGSVVWTARAISTASLLATISGTPTWTVPTGYTVSGEAINNNIASALIAVPAAANGDDAQVTILPVRSDAQVLPQLVILPVRTPTVRACPC